MTEEEYYAGVELCFLEIEQWLEATHPSVDFENQEARLTLFTPQDTQLILSRQTTLKEIWVAAPQGAYRFGFKKGVVTQAGQWVSTSPPFLTLIALLDSLLSPSLKESSLA